MQKIYKINDVAKIRSGMVVTKTTNRNRRKVNNTFVRAIDNFDFDDDGNLRKKIQP